MTTYNVPLIIRGGLYQGDDLVFSGRGDQIEFSTPDVGKVLDELMLTSPNALSDLYTISFGEIVEYLDNLGRRLSFSSNEHLQQAFELSSAVTGLTEPLLRQCYETLGSLFRADFVREVADSTVGIDYLDGWVEQAQNDGSTISIRAFGARTVHVVAGNVPSVSATTIVRNAICRSDGIIKAPSNDPLTASAIARTMIDMAPDHCLTKHLSVVYWKGGNQEIEDRIYRPQNIEKIVAWGGFSSVSHIRKYIQPGIDLVALDPKLSSTIIGPEAFASDRAMLEAAERLAMDIGALNQEGCVNSRVIYAVCGSDADGIALANSFGAHVYTALVALPEHFSGAVRMLDRSLASEIRGLSSAQEWYKVIGGGNEGGVIVSQIDSPVDFAHLLMNRVANIVPIDDLNTALRAVNAYTQTVGIYPDQLKTELRDALSLAGAQRLVCLGGAARPSYSGPQDAIEPLRRMCKWIIDETRPAEQIMAL